MKNTDPNINQLAQIQEFMSEPGHYSYAIQESLEKPNNSISIPLMNGNQTANLLIEINKIQQGTVFRPEDMVWTFNSNLHKFLILTRKS
jgi:hypothetical protein